MRYAGAGFVATGMAAGAGAAFTGEPLSTVVGTMFSMVPLGAFWIWVAPRILDAVQRREFARDAKEEGREVEVVSLSADGIIPGKRWARPVPWAEVKRIRETERLILIEASSEGPAYLPKNALTAADLTNLEVLLREQFRDRPKDLRLLATRPAGSPTR